MRNAVYFSRTIRTVLIVVGILFAVTVLAWLIFGTVSGSGVNVGG